MSFLRATGALVALVAGALIAGAASSAVATVTGAVLPPPDMAGAPVDATANYRIGPLDTLDISVFRVDTLTRTLQVDASGHIEFPLIGTVVAAGKTPSDLGKEIAARLAEGYLQSPEVSVTVKEILSQRFTVEGSVKAPGIYPVVGRMTLLRAIATAQGVTDDAKPQQIVVFRVVNAQRMAGVVNLSDVRSGKVDDPQIYAGDMIVVPQSAARRAWRDLLSATPLLFFVHP